ncbi:MAG: hypothetical protein ACTSSB_13335 [Candidatus Heimdallarchaeota archaeon]
MNNPNFKNFYWRRKIFVLVVLILGLIISSSFLKIHNTLKLEASSNFCTDYVSISADEPNITSSHNFWYLEGETGNSITWNITDFTVNNPTYYVEQISLLTIQHIMLKEIV